ncbi:MAG: hypothetical protein ACXWFJ_00215 [Candidatus Aminicenantales bacterium]
MTRRCLPGLAVFAALTILAAAAGAVLAEVPPEIRAKAAGIFAALKRIEAEAERTPARAVPSSTAAKPGSRSLTFSEDELNAYAACRTEDEPYVKAAVLKLLAGDKIEGRITIDLGKPLASGLVQQKQDLLFAARVETRGGKIRINMDSLYLGTQAISPAFIDVIIGLVSRLQGVEPTTLKDWYDLPPGVLRLESRPGKVVVIY